MGRFLNTVIVLTSAANAIVFNAYTSEDCTGTPLGSDAPPLHTCERQASGTKSFKMLADAKSNDWFSFYHNDDCVAEGNWAQAHLPFPSGYCFKLTGGADLLSYKLSTVSQGG